MKKLDHVTLTDEAARFAAAQVAAGRFRSIDDVLAAGVEALQQRDEAAGEWLGYAREKWRAGQESSAGGKAVEMDDGQFSAFLDDCLPEAPHAASDPPTQLSHTVKSPLRH